MSFLALICRVGKKGVLSTPAFIINFSMEIFKKVLGKNELYVILNLISCKLFGRQARFYFLDPVTGRQKFKKGRD
jgi:hypothetical protein